MAADNQAQLGSTHAEINATFEDALVDAIINGRKLERAEEPDPVAGRNGSPQDLQPSRIGSHSNLLQVPSADLA